MVSKHKKKSKFGISVAVIAFIFFIAGAFVAMYMVKENTEAATEKIMANSDIDKVHVDVLGIDTLDIVNKKQGAGKLSMSDLSVVRSAVFEWIPVIFGLVFAGIFTAVAFLGRHLFKKSARKGWKRSK